MIAIVQNVKASTQPFPPRANSNFLTIVFSFLDAPDFTLTVHAPEDSSAPRPVPGDRFNITFDARPIVVDKAQGKLSLGNAPATTSPPASQQKPTSPGRASKTSKKRKSRD